MVLIARQRAKSLQTTRLRDSACAAVMAMPITPSRQPGWRSVGLADIVRAFASQRARLSDPGSSHIALTTARSSTAIRVEKAIIVNANRMIDKSNQNPQKRGGGEDFVFALKLTGIPTAPSSSDRTRRLLSSYPLNMDRGCPAVREMILQDIRRFSEMGADAYVADLRKALFRFDDETCEAT